MKFRLFLLLALFGAVLFQFYPGIGTSISEFWHPSPPLVEDSTAGRGWDHDFPEVTTIPFGEIPNFDLRDLPWSDSSSEPPVDPVRHESSDRADGSDVQNRDVQERLDALQCIIDGLRG